MHAFQYFGTMIDLLREHLRLLEGIRRTIPSLSIILSCEVFAMLTFIYRHVNRQSQ